ncbi:MAG: hypothetical protein AAFV86_19565 [Pseudomonadota bacterium]
MEDFDFTFATGTVETTATLEDTGNYSLQVNDETYTSQNERVVGMTYNMLHNLQSNAAEMATETMIEYALAYEEIEVTYDDGTGAVEAEDDWLEPAKDDGAPEQKEEREPYSMTDNFDFV